MATPWNTDKKLSIIVPVYNEGDRLTANLDLLVREVEPFFQDYEILVISDGSTDSTPAVLKQLETKYSRMKVFLLEQNRGKGFAVRKGFHEATGNWVLFIDGGMELHPKEIRVFCGLMDLYEADCIVGSKRHPQSQVEYPWIRRVLSYGFQKATHLLFDLDITDTQVGIKLFRKELITAVLPFLSIDRYGFDIEILALGKRLGFPKVLEAPIRLDYFGRSARPPLKELLHIRKICWEILKDTWRIYRKLHNPQVHPCRESQS